MSAETQRLTRPPFAVDDTLGAPQVGAEMVACFAQLAARPDCLQYGHRLAARAIGLPESDPLLRAGQAIAQDVDRGIGAGITAGYHNRQHFLEVMLSALYLARLVPLDPRRTERVVTAALLHDFHHDGSRSFASPFRLELLALKQAQPYLRAAGVDDGERRCLEALVLATEPRNGVQFARECWVRHATGAPAEALAPALPPQIEPLQRDPQLAEEAVLLTEADVLPSIGLTFEHAEELQSRLADEWDTRLGCDDKLQFIDRMIGDISVATFFLPNMEAFRQAYRGER